MEISDKLTEKQVNSILKSARFQLAEYEKAQLTNDWRVIDRARMLIEVNAPNLLRNLIRIIDEKGLSPLPTPKDDLTAIPGDDGRFHYADGNGGTLCRTKTASEVPHWPAEFCQKCDELKSTT
jgi:hypothetical protein